MKKNDAIYLGERLVEMADMIIKLEARIVYLEARERKRQFLPDDVVWNIDPILCTSEEPKADG